jgi:hypothetical protein
VKIFLLGAAGNAGRCATLITREILRGGEAGGSSGRTAHQVRSCYQSDHGQKLGHNLATIPNAGRLGNRMKPANVRFTSDSGRQNGL